jgi:hypothetical protein
VAIYMPRIKNPVSVAAVFAAIDRDEKKAKAPAKADAKALAPLAAKRAPQLAHPKESVWRSEPYRRLVARLPCKNCQVHDRSQAAHIPPDGKGIKVDDRLTFPLCTLTTGKPGCHEKFDNYKLGDRAWAVKQGEKWAAETRAELLASGQLTAKQEAAIKAFKPLRKRK